jgi:hypothetical protein
MEKLEAAKLATQLTVALLADKSGMLNEVAEAAGARRGGETPKAVAVFDYLLNHVQSRLKEQ